MRKSLPTEINTEPTIYKSVTINSVIVILVFLFLGFQLQERVYEPLRVPFIIFNVIVGLLFCIQSQSNKQKKFYQSLVLMLFRDKTVYKPVPNPKKMPDTMYKYKKSKGVMQYVEPKSEENEEIF